MPNNEHFIYTLRIDLDIIRPPIWRRIEVDGRITLDMLSEVILAAFDWSGSHMHAFHIHGERYGCPDDDNGDLGFRDEEEVNLAALVELGDEFVYIYDFGDDWQHLIKVEQVTKSEKHSSFMARLVSGKRACPPEDVGGPYGYEEFLLTIADPKSPEGAEMLEWAGGDFDPENFDQDELKTLVQAVSERE